MKLQVRFQNDERFRMDEKFIDEFDLLEVDFEEEEKYGYFIFLNCLYDFLY